MTNDNEYKEKVRALLWDSLITLPAIQFHATSQGNQEVLPLAVIRATFLVDRLSRLQPPIRQRKFGQHCRRVADDIVTFATEVEQRSQETWPVDWTSFEPRFSKLVDAVDDCVATGDDRIK